MFRPVTIPWALAILGLHVWSTPDLLVQGLSPDSGTMIQTWMDLDTRLSGFIETIPESLEKARQAITSAKIKKNRKQLSFGIAITLAAILNIQSGLVGRDLKKLTPADINLHLSTALNGYSFGFIYIFEGQLNNPHLACGGEDFLQLLEQYQPLLDQTALRHELVESRSQKHPFSLLDSTTLPIYSGLQITRLEEDLSNQLFCILSQTGGSTEALSASQSIQSFFQTLRQRDSLISSLVESALASHLAVV